MKKFKFMMFFVGLIVLDVVIVLVSINQNNTENDFLNGVFVVLGIIGIGGFISSMFIKDK